LVSVNRTLTTTDVGRLQDLLIDRVTDNRAASPDRYQSLRSQVLSDGEAATAAPDWLVDSHDLESCWDRARAAASGTGSWQRRRQFVREGLAPVFKVVANRPPPPPGTEPLWWEDDTTVIEMGHRWGDIESRLPNYRQGEDTEIGGRLAGEVAMAFRIEATRGDYDGLYYRLLFDVENELTRDAGHAARESAGFLRSVVKQELGYEAGVEVNVVALSEPHDGMECGRPGKPPPKRRADLSDVPVSSASSGGKVPLTDRDGYLLTPIEVPFYDALKSTGLTFSVQPWAQQADRRFRLDFLVFYAGGIVGVELDGHETHKSKEDRGYDTARERWFAQRGIQIHRWTGSQVTRDPAACVAELLDILRRSDAAP